MLNNLSPDVQSTIARLDEIEAREKAAAKGPWITIPYQVGDQPLLMVRSESELYPETNLKDPGHNNICYMAVGLGLKHDHGPKCHQLKEANGDFIANIRDDAPAMAKALREVVKRLGELQAELEQAKRQPASHDVDEFYKDDTDNV